MRKLLGDNDVLAYLVMMTARLVELHRVLKPIGSLYLHCDSTAGHYLKIILDSIFGAERFINEIIWKRSSAHSDAKQGSMHYGRVSDTLLFYSKGNDKIWNNQYQPYDKEYIDRDYRRIELGTGRRYRIDNLQGPGGAAKGNPYYEVMGVWRYWRHSKKRMDQLIAEGRVIQTSPGTVPQYKRYLDEMPGVLLQNVWTDIPVINNRSREKLGYPTQKPLALLERIVKASSNKDDVVLDPFAGCGTTIDAAQKLGRRWIGIDITTLAVDLIDARLRHTYSESIRTTYDIVGIPKDLTGANALFAKSPFEFERWCVMLVDGQPNEKQVGDRGVDGVIRIPTDNKGGSEKVLVSVKGGASNPGHVRDLIGTVESQRAAMGLFICLRAPTRGMLDAAEHSQIYTYPVTNRAYPKAQILTVADLLDGKQPDMPTSLLPYFQAPRRLNAAEQYELGILGV